MTVSYRVILALVAWGGKRGYGCPSSRSLERDDMEQPMSLWVIASTRLLVMEEARGNP